MTIPDYLALAATSVTSAVLMIAESDIGEIAARFMNVGVAGVMLWWFMWKIEPTLKAIQEDQHKEALANQEAMDRVARATLLLVVSSGLKPLQEQSTVMLTELDKAAEEREKRKHSSGEKGEK